MTDFATRRLPAEPDVVAQDGSDVRILLTLAGGGMAHFTLAPGQVSAAVVHRTVEEIWYVVAGRGQMRRWQDVATRSMCGSMPMRRSRSPTTEAAFPSPFTPRWASRRSRWS